MVDSSQIFYKIIVPDNVAPSSYHYQKFFRALYGYHQNVTKSNGKVYKYFRPGVLSNVPYFKHGKCLFTIQSKHVSLVESYFKTGKNPGHDWHVKHLFKVVYKASPNVLSKENIIFGLEQWLDRTYIDTNKGEIGIMDAINRYNEVNPDHQQLSNSFKVIVSDEWFEENKNYSPILARFISQGHKILGER